ncbi:hypothetical protein Dda_6693 [Drechslerella dactyloides]|uniref:Uncharacterized protein n=1 Tax=Drechslerella dactyloides TaxID=74499 RepID=A0AAD6IW21_DREDA|nr:hypothetical protein Dda_6693 [Drechslerella dactyloides]
MGQHCDSRGVDASVPTALPAGAQKSCHAPGQAAALDGESGARCDRGICNKKLGGRGARRLLSPAFTCQIAGVEAGEQPNTGGTAGSDKIGR